MDQDENWRVGRPRPWPHCVRWRPSYPLPKRGPSPPPQFSAHAHCGQRAERIKTALGMEVGLGPGHIVLDGDPAPSPKRGWTRSPSPIFGPFLLWPNGWMHQDATWYGGRSQPGDFVLDGDPAPLPRKRAKPPNFRPMSIVAKRLSGSRWHLAWRWALVQATLCWVGTQLPPQKRRRSPQIFGPFLLWPRSPISATAELLFTL